MSQDVSTGVVHQGSGSIQPLHKPAGAKAARHERERVWVEVVGCGRLERWSLHITMSLPITQTGFRPASLGFWSTIGFFFSFFLTTRCQVVNCKVSKFKFGPRSQSKDEHSALAPGRTWRSHLSKNLCTWLSYTVDMQNRPVGSLHLEPNALVFYCPQLLESLLGSPTFDIWLEGNIRGL